MLRRPTALALALLLAPAALAAREAAQPAAETGAVAALLDDFHRAAAAADEERYFAHLAESAVFIGTDATERWSKPEFRAFAHPYFARGQGWTFVPGTRHVDFSSDGRVAWFDEALASASYGDCRGTGVLQKIGGTWRIEQYHLTIPVPNELAKEVVARIRGARAAPTPAPPPR